MLLLSWELPMPLGNDTVAVVVVVVAGTVVVGIEG